MMPDANFDEDGYPTDEALGEIENFVGTPAEFVKFVTALYRNGFVKVEQLVDDWNRGFRRITFVTGGWSGCESVMSALNSGTLFNMTFWRKSERGGLDVFEVSDAMWDSESDWGRFFPKPAVEWAAQLVSEDGTLTTISSESQSDAVALVTAASGPNNNLVWREVGAWHKREIDSL